MLYSYLLTKGNFKLRTPAPDAPAPAQFTFTAYKYLLLTVMRLSGGCGVPQLSVPGEVSANKYLKGNQVARIMGADSEMRSIAVRDEEYSEVITDSVLIDVYHALVKSSAYRSYIMTRKKSLEGDVKFWITVLGTVVMRTPSMQAALRSLPSYSMRGEEAALDMAVSSIDELAMTSLAVVNARKQLETSLDKAYQLYHMLLQLPVELTRMEELRLDNARNKYLATSEDLNPNTRFVDNRLFTLLASSKELADYFAEHPYDWSDDRIWLGNILDAIKQTDEYREYMSLEESDLKTDCEFWRTMFRKVILPGDELAEALESKSVYWNDDLDIIGTFVTKTIRRIADKQEGDFILLPQYKDDEDAEYGRQLFDLTVDNFDLYRSYIDKFLDQRSWDTDRLAFMDVVIMAATLAEILNFPSVPLPVSINEYVEIAHYYSTPRSGQFINGVLFSVIEYLRKEGMLEK